MSENTTQINQEGIKIEEESSASERAAIPFVIRFVKFLGWFLFLFGVAGAVASYYYFQVVTFEPDFIIDPFGCVVVLMCLLIALMGFPVIKIFSYIAESVCIIRYRLDKEG